MPNALLLTVDVEEFVLPAEYGIPFDAEAAYALGARGLDALAETLNEQGVPATLFVTAAFARRFPEALRRLVASGSEIALHAEEHAHDYRAMPPERARLLLARAREEIERTLGAPVRGYRANRFRSPSRALLRDLGLQWTSNLHPAWVPGSYDNRRSPREIHVDDGLLEVPISVTPKLRLPVSWFWMRNLGWPYLRATASRSARGTGYLNLYVHPWEYAALPALPGLPLMGRLSMRRTGRRFLALTGRLLRWSKEAGFEATTISRRLEAVGFLTPCSTPARS